MTAADWLITALIVVAAGGLAWVAWLTLHPTGRRGTRRPAPLPVVLPAVGSMCLEDERAGLCDGFWGYDYVTYLCALPAGHAPPCIDAQGHCSPEHHDWREQTMTELAPEALDPGPGGLVSSLPPGPDQFGQIVDAGRFDSAPDGPGSDHPLSGGPGPSALAHDLERLADTGDIRAAHFDAELVAEMRAMDGDAEDFMSSIRQECAQMRLDLAEAMA